MSVVKQKERRGRVRLPYRCKLDLRTELGIFKGAEMDNISMSGMFVRISHPVPIEGKVTAAINLVVPGSRLLIEIDGTVVRSTKEGLGIKFDNEFKFWAVLSTLAGFVRQSAES